MNILSFRLPLRRRCVPFALAPAFAVAVGCAGGAPRAELPAGHPANPGAATAAYDPPPNPFEESDEASEPAGGEGASGSSKETMRGHGRMRGMHGMRPTEGMPHQPDHGHGSEAGAAGYEPPMPNAERGQPGKVMRAAPAGDDGPTGSNNAAADPPPGESPTRAPIPERTREEGGER